MSAFRTKRKSEPPNLTTPQSIVSILVGQKPNQETFTLHKSYLTYYSPYFRAAFDGGFLEGETQTISLEETDGASFGCVAHWMYYQKLKDVEVDGKILTNNLIFLAKLWQLAQMLIMPTLQNRITDRIMVVLCNFGGRRCSMDDVAAFYHYIYDFMQDTPLCRLAAQSLAFADPGLHKYPSLSSDIPGSMLIDVASILKKQYDEAMRARFEKRRTLGLQTVMGYSKNHHVEDDTVENPVRIKPEPSIVDVLSDEDDEI